MANQQTPSCCFFLSLETGVALIAIVIAISAIETTHLAVKHKCFDLMTPIIATYASHTFLTFFHFCCNFDGVFFRQLLVLTSFVSAIMNFAYRFAIVNMGLGGIQASDCKQSDFKSSCDASE